MVDLKTTHTEKTAAPPEDTAADHSLKKAIYAVG